VKYLAFDIETRVDKALLRRTYRPSAKGSDEDVYQEVRQQLIAEHGSDFVPVSFHVPVCIVLGSIGDNLVLTSVETLGDETAEPAALAREFWTRIEAADGVLLSFNGRGFDLPVLELQALRYGIEAPRYFNERNGQRYRYSDRHYDLYEFLSNFGAHRIRGGLDLLSQLVGLPGKGEVTGSDVQKLWESGRREDIRRYCRRDVIQTYLLFLRVERMRGRINDAQLAELWRAGAPWMAELCD